MRDMYKIVAVALIAVATTQVAAAADSSFGDVFTNAKPYVALDVGQTQAKLNDQNIGGVTASGNVLGNDAFTQGSIAVGAEINPHFAVELGYTQSNNQSKEITAFGSNAKITNSYNGITLDAIGKLPVADKLALVGTAGIIRAKVKSDVQGSGFFTGMSQERNETDTALRAGVGAEYELSNCVALRTMLRYTGSLGNDVDHATTASVGVAYKF